MSPRRATLTLAVVTALGAHFGATATPAAQAAVVSATIEGDVAVLNLDGAADAVTVSVEDGLLAHPGVIGLKSSVDWDSTTDGDQTLAADGSHLVIVNGGGGDDTLSARVPSGDLVELNGGDGNDLFPWDDGGGSAFADGDAGRDTIVVSGSPTLGDSFALRADAGRLVLERTDPAPFTLNASAERVRIEGLGGNDSVTAAPDTGALTRLSIDGGTGADTITGSDGPDLITGGQGDDVLHGGDGDDTFVWDDGDGSDVIEGDLGVDTVQVTGSPTGADAFAVTERDRRIAIARTNLTPFALDVASSEELRLAGSGGDDAFDIGDLGTVVATVDGGAGADVISAGGGLDFVQGGDGNDRIDIRDGGPDLADGGSGTDAVVADGPDLDAIDGFESVDRPSAASPPAPVVPPQPVVPPASVPPSAAAVPVAIRGGTAKVTRGRAAVAIRCPASARGACTGVVVLRTPNGVRLGRANYNVAAGASARVNVKLTSGARKLADRRGRLRVVAMASTGVAGRIAGTSRRLTLVPR